MKPSRIAVHRTLFAEIEGIGRDGIESCDAGQMNATVIWRLIDELRCAYLALRELNS